VLQLQDVQASALHHEWECSKCQNISYATRSKCNKCGQLGPKAPPAVNHFPTGVRKARTGSYLPPVLQFRNTQHACTIAGQQDTRGHGNMLKPGVSLQDVLKCTDKELRDCALEKMHPNFQQAFQEAGTPAQPGLPPGSVAGNADSITAAMSKRGQERLHHIIRVLSGACLGQLLQYTAIRVQHSS
jgi:hypothetical protein